MLSTNAFSQYVGVYAHNGNRLFEFSVSESAEGMRWRSVFMQSESLHG